VTGPVPFHAQELSNPPAVVLDVRVCWPLFSGHVEQTVRVVGEKIKRICSVKLPHLVFVANSNMACKKSKTRFRIQIMVLPPPYRLLPP
jgi:hypothetical protein